MLILDWVMDKLGYTKKVSWHDLILEWECQKPKRKPAVKKPATKKPAVKKTIRKKV
jgi:hypothetical protein